MKRLPPVQFCMIVGALALLALAAGCGEQRSRRRFQGSERRTWKATAIAGLASVQTAKGTAATAEFWAGEVGGSGSVNSWGASYQPARATPSRSRTS